MKAPHASCGLCRGMLAVNVDIEGMWAFSGMSRDQMKDCFLEPCFVCQWPSWFSNCNSTPTIIYYHLLQIIDCMLCWPIVHMLYGLYRVIVAVYFCPILPSSFRSLLKSRGRSRRRLSRIARRMTIWVVDPNTFNERVRLDIVFRQLKVDFLDKSGMMWPIACSS